MKIKPISFVGVLLLLVLGCKREAQSTQPPSPTNYAIFSNGGFSMYVKAVVVNGTNVPLTNVTFTPLTNKESK